MTFLPHHQHDTIPRTAGLRGKLKKLLCFGLFLAVFFLLLTLAVQSSRNADLFSASSILSIFFLHSVFVHHCRSAQSRTCPAPGSLRLVSDPFRPRCGDCPGLHDGWNRKLLFIPLHARDHKFSPAALPARQACLPLPHAALSMDFFSTFSTSGGFLPCNSFPSPAAARQRNLFSSLS